MLEFPPNNNEINICAGFLASLNLQVVEIKGFSKYTLIATISENRKKNHLWFLGNAAFLFYIISAIWMVLGMCIVQRSSCSHFKIR